MPLTSKLFAGDKALEACLVSDPAHVTPGARGPHVGKIQAALVTLGEAVIAAAEITKSEYGKSTASAVLAYKTKRNIINRAYQAKADNIVGKMTIAALDKELAARETPLNACPACAFGRGGVRSRFVSTPATPPPAIQLPAQMALTRVGDAKLWVALSLAWLTHLETLAMGARLRAPAKPVWDFGGADPVALEAAKTHFKVHRAFDTLLHLRRIRKVYQDMQFVFQNADGFFANDLIKVDFAYAFGGSLRNRTPSDPLRHIFFCWPFISANGTSPNGPLFQTMVIIHEAGHFVDVRVGHSASELPAPNGSPVPTTGNLSGHDYANMTDHDAFTNAYSYAQFALHAFKGFDHRITPFGE